MMLISCCTGLELWDSGIPSSGLQGHRCCLGAAHQQPSSQPSEWNFLPAAQKLLSHSEISDNHIPDYPARHASLLNLVVASHGRRLGRRCESHHCQLL